MFAPYYVVNVSRAQADAVITR